MAGACFNSIRRALPPPQGLTLEASSPGSFLPFPTQPGDPLSPPVPILHIDTWGHLSRSPTGERPLAEAQGWAPTPLGEAPRKQAPTVGEQPSEAWEAGASHRPVRRAAAFPLQRSGLCSVPSRTCGASLGPCLPSRLWGTHRDSQTHSLNTLRGVSGRKCRLPDLCHSP